MTNTNNKILIENKKVETAEVQELQENWWEKYNKKTSYLSKSAQNLVNKKSGSDYQSIRMTSEDIALMQMYGPGFWDEFGLPVAKFAGKAVISTVAAGSIIASGGATAPLLLATGATGWGTGKLVSAAAKECDNKLFEWVGDTVSDTGANVLTGSLVGTHKAFKSLATVISEDPSNSFKYQLVREFQQMYSKWEDVKDIKAVEFHAKHVGAGIKYHSWCGVCN